MSLRLWNLHTPYVALPRVRYLITSIEGGDSASPFLHHQKIISWILDIVRTSTTNVMFPTSIHSSSSSVQLRRIDRLPPARHSFYRSLPSLSTVQQPLPNNESSLSPLLASEQLTTILLYARRRPMMIHHCLDPVTPAAVVRVCRSSPWRGSNRRPTDAASMMPRRRLHQG